MKLMLDDFVCLSSDVKIVSYFESYRAINVTTGIIIKLNTTSALIMSIIEKKKTFLDLIKNFTELLNSNQIDKKSIKNFLLDLYCKGFVEIEKNKLKATVLLINPCSCNSKSNYRKNNSSPPLGLIMIGTTISNNNYNVIIIDMDIENLIVKDILYRVKDIKFNYVGISMNFTKNAKNSIEIAKKIKSRYKNIPIIVGGNHATFTYEEVLTDENIDFVVKYNGHDTFVDLINILEKKDYQYCDLVRCKGIAFRHEAKIISTQDRDRVYDLNEIPLFDWNLIQLPLYSEKHKWNLFTSIGCTNSCNFCSTSAFNGKCGRMNYLKIIEHIENIFKYENNNTIVLSFVDDAFTADKKRIINLCEEIIKRKLKIKWGCNARVDQVDCKLLGLMKKAGCSDMFFGIESCDEHVLLNTNKKLKTDIKQKLLEVKSYGIAITLSFIIGLPKETRSSLLKIKEFVNSVKPNYARFGFLVLYPGTEYYNNKEKYGIKQIITDWNQYECYMPYIETEDLSVKDQMEALIMLTESFYDVIDMEGKNYD